MHIIVAGTIDLSGDNRDEILLSAKSYIDDAKSESGCLAYEWTADPYMANRIHVFEEWSSQAELADHLKAPSYLNMLGHLGTGGIEQSQTQKYQIKGYEPVYDDAGTPRADFFTQS